MSLSSVDKHLPDSFIVPNTTQGHCAKTYSLLVEADKILRRKNLDWLIISDDDTIFRYVCLFIIYNIYNLTMNINITLFTIILAWHACYVY